MLALIQFFIGSYQEFRFKKSLVKTFYTNSEYVPTKHELKNDPSRTTLMENLRSRSRIRLKFYDSLKATLLRVFCCCWKSSEWYHRR